MEDNIQIIQEDKSKKDSSIAKLKAKNIFKTFKSNNYIDSTFNEIKNKFSNSISKNKQKKIRNPGVDIIRIIGMYGIIINHLLYLYGYILQTRSYFVESQRNI